MTSSEKKYYGKKFMPSYMRAWNIAMPLMAVALGVFAFAFALTYALNLLGTKVMLILAIVLLVYVVVFLICILAFKGVFDKKLVAQRKKELEEEYTDMSLEEATEVLTGRGIINEKGFIIPAMADGSGVLPFIPYGEAKINLYSANVCSKIFTVVSICNPTGAVMVEYLVDKAMYNYLLKSKSVLTYYGGSDKLFGDKGEFVKKVIKIRNSKGFGYSLLGGWVGTMLAENAKNETPEMEAVLRVLRRENI